LIDQTQAPFLPSFFPLAMKDKCITKRCKNKRRKTKLICSTCDKKQWRLKFPMKAAYQTLRQNARRRGIYFDLTYAQFEKFCIETDYMKGKGKTALSFSIDRVQDGPLPGYTITNLRTLTLSDNTKKENARRKKLLVYDYRTREATVI
jgi:hypothetical protein